MASRAGIHSGAFAPGKLRFAAFRPGTIFSIRPLTETAP